MRADQSVGAPQPQPPASSAPAAPKIAPHTQPRARLRRGRRVGRRLRAVGDEAGRMPLGV